MTDLRCLVYASTAVRPMDEADLRAMLLDARWRNAACGVTGVLLCHDDTFMQCLEGAPGAVGTVFGRIARDHRHRSVYVLMDELVSRRRFADWTMGLAQPAASEMLRLSTARWQRQALVPSTADDEPNGLELLQEFWAGARR